MRCLSVVQLVLAAALISACSLAGGSGSTTPESAVASRSASPLQQVPLPRGFPVPAGATPAVMPVDDPELIGLWTAEVHGSDAYDFYVRALPSAGYRIVAAYPGGAAAVIRFSLPDGAIWQVVMRTGPDGSVAIEVRLDRP